MSDWKVALDPEQRKALDRLIAVKKGYLYAPMGAGKSYVAAQWIADVIARGAKRVLIVAPPKVAKNVWTREHIRQFVDPAIDIERLREDVGGRVIRLKKALASDVTITLVNMTLLQWLASTKFSPDAVVVDEATKLAAARSQNAMALRKMLKRAKTPWRLIMSGTPLHCGLLTAWGQYVLVDDGHRLCRTFGKFRELTHIGITPYPGAKFMKWEMRDKAIEGVAGLVGDVTVKMTPRAESRPTVKLIEEFNMSPGGRKYYREVAKGVTPDNVEPASHAGSLSGQLRQVAHGFLYDDQRRPLWLYMERKEALRNLLLRLNEPALIFASFTADYSVVEDVCASLDLKHEHINDAGAIGRWNTRQLDALISHPLSGGHGLNLQSGGSVVIWYGLPWSLDQYDQANARLARRGQRETVRIIHMVAKGTMDERIMDALENKREVPNEWNGEIPDE